MGGEERIVFLLLLASFCFCKGARLPPGCKLKTGESDVPPPLTSLLPSDHSSKKKSRDILRNGGQSFKETPAAWLFVLWAWVGGNVLFGGGDKMCACVIGREFLLVYSYCMYCL